MTPDLVLYSPKRTLMPQGLLGEYSGESIEKFKEFCQKYSNNYLVGYLSYDLGYQLHQIARNATDDLKMPKIYFKAFKELKEEKFTAQAGVELPHFKSKISKKDYQKAFEKVQKYLREGEIYQINYSHRLEAPAKISGKDLFNQVIIRNPSEYAAYIKGADFEVICLSPERFIKVTEGKIETRPIKGTRPRSKNQEKDEAMLKELLESGKEKAELDMITDLLRNDTAKVSKPGTRKVIAHREVQECATVWHTYSRIEAELKTTPLEALLSMFPGGSITGCPKKRAMEIIDEIEPQSRGLYTGCIGYISPQQKELEFNIAIRTSILKNSKFYLQVGGGIVIDSDPEKEFQETLDKAAAFTKNQ